ncbi:MAG: 5-formyltetrahydrofolate cyclo-ligase [Gracilibacteraceae bacterium]|jgi:5-formyltetrahydrofolate cyclo-ligase|nr:5-formyltetrahydrofolate cyclo-ligase [Gracilibacteraceae bacterium]
MPDGSVRKKKAALRKILRQKMGEADPATKQSEDEAICARLIALPEYERAQAVFCFVGTGPEISTLPILRHALAAGKRVCAPLCLGPGQMEARSIGSLDELSPGAYGIPEPQPNCPPVAAGEIDFAVVPCLACDREGRRLGQGGGFYDRFMSGRRFPAFALCRETLFAEEIPQEPWDQSVDGVVTEARVIRARVS